MKPDFPREYGYGNQVSASLYEIPVKYLREWNFRQCLLFSWTTLRGKHYQHPIAVMEVVDMFMQELVNCLLLLKHTFDKGFKRISDILETRT